MGKGGGREEEREGKREERVSQGEGGREKVGKARGVREVGSLISQMSPFSFLSYSASFFIIAIVYSTQCLKKSLFW